MRRHTIEIACGISTHERSIEPVVVNWLVGFDLIDSS